MQALFSDYLRLLDDKVYLESNTARHHRCSVVQQAATGAAVPPPVPHVTPKRASHAARSLRVQHFIGACSSCN